jgi:hypothetical protein
MRIKINDKIFVTPREYAEMNDLCIKSIYNKIHRGNLETKRILGKLLVRLS